MAGVGGTRRGRGAGARALRTLGLLALAAGVGGCAATSRGPAPRPPARAPAADLVAEGVSDSGFAQAEAQARAQVAAQVSSELSAVLTTVMGSRSRDGRVEDWQRLVSETATVTSFAHAEMIRVDPASRRFEHGLYHATARLSRAEAADALAHDYELAALDFRAAVADLEKPGGETAAWSATLRRAESEFGRLSRAVFGLRAVTRGEHGPWLEDVGRYERVERLRAGRLAATRLALEVGGDGGAAPLAASLAGALARLGLAPTIGDCPAGGYRLRLAPEVRWETGPFGPLCRLTLTGQLLACDGRRTLGPVSLAHPDFAGTDVRERERALAALWQRVDEERLALLLRHELAPYLPVAER